MHPDWQQKARDELLHISANRPLDFEAINQLKIVSSFVYPPNLESVLVFDFKKCDFMHRLEDFSIKFISFYVADEVL